MDRTTHGRLMNLIENIALGLTNSNKVKHRWAKDIRQSLKATGVDETAQIR